MIPSDKKSKSAGSPRQQAEKILRARTKELSRSPRADVEELVHELGIHQIELEMQNEELRESQRELQEAHDRYNDLYDFAPVGYLTLDSGKMIRDANLTAAALLGVNRGDVVQKDVAAFITREDQDPFHLWWRKLLRSKTEQDLEIRCRKADGGYFWAYLRAVPVLGGGGETDLIRLAMSDVSARISAEEELTRILRDLTNQKRGGQELLRAKEEAETANIAKNEFLSNINHELRSPLSSVVGFSDMLLLQSTEEKTLLLAEKIKDSGLYLTRLIEELLDIDRIDAGKIRLEMEKIKINDLISEIVSAWHSRLPENLSLRCDRDFSIGLLLCDQTRIKQIMTNLLENAVKYSPRGGLLSIRTQRKANEVWICVQDEGMGMDAAEVDVIFDRFKQLESGHTRSAGGLGIGLNLVRKLVELHGGRVWAESEKGAGSTFTFSLPIGEK